MTEEVEKKEEIAESNKLSDKELNFRQLQAKYEKQLEMERQARLEAERKAQEWEQRQQSQEDDDDDDEPYIDRKKLAKNLEKFGQKTKEYTKAEIQKAVGEALNNERKQNWLKTNNDFYDVMQHAEKLANLDPELAETILQMPDTFERQKLVYRQIKAMGLHKPKEEKTDVQNRIDQNKRSPYYQPSGIATAPYSGGGDFSPTGQKNAYQRMQELKARMRLG